MNEPKLLVFEEASNAIARIHGGQVTFSFDREIFKRCMNENQNILEASIDNEFRKSERLSDSWQELHEESGVHPHSSTQQ